MNQILSLDTKADTPPLSTKTRHPFSGSLLPRENSFSVLIEVKQAGTENGKNVRSLSFLETKDSTK